MHCIAHFMLCFVVLQAVLGSCCAFNAATASGPQVTRTARPKSTRRWPFQTSNAAVNRLNPITKQKKKSLQHEKAKSRMEPAAASLPPPPEAAITRAIVQKHYQVTLDDVISITGSNAGQLEDQLLSLAARSNAQVTKSKDGKIVFVFPSNFQQVLISKRLKNIRQTVAQSIRSTCKAMRGIAMPVASAAWMGAAFILSALLLPTSSRLSEQTVNATQKWEQDVSHAQNHAHMHANISLEEYETWEGVFERKFGTYSPASFYDPVKRKFYDPQKGRFYTPPSKIGYERFYGERVISQPAVGAKNEALQDQASQAELGTIEAITSYLFGDHQPLGTPFSEAQMHAVVRVIRDNGGVVAAEQLGPYLNPPPVSQYLEGTTDTRFILPVLQKLGGRPVLTADGDLVYRFPTIPDEQYQVHNSPDLRQFSIADREGLKAITQGNSLAALQRAGIGITANSVLDKNVVFQKLVELCSQQMTQANDAPVPSVLYEQQAPFSLAPERQQNRMARWGVASLVASAAAGIDLVRRIITNGVGKLDKLLKTTVPALLVSSLTFNLVPAIRYRILHQRNVDKVARNKIREEWADYLAAPDKRLRKKLAGARKLATRPHVKAPKEFEVEARADLSPTEKDSTAGRLKNPMETHNFPL